MIDKVTVFAVNVTNAKTRNVSGGKGQGLEGLLEIEKLSFSDKSLKVLIVCEESALRTKDIFFEIGVTNQTNNVRNIINPLIEAGCLTVAEEDEGKRRNRRYTATSRGKEYLHFYLSKTSKDPQESKKSQIKEPLLFSEFENR